MKKRKARKGSLERKWHKLRREGRSTIRSGLGYTPAGIALTTYDTTRGTVRTVKAAKEYLEALGDDTKRRMKKHLPSILFD